MDPNPEDITLSEQERDELIRRVETNRLSAADRQLLVKILRCFFWVIFSLREAKISLQRLKTLLFGQSPPRGGGSRDEDDEDPDSGGGGSGHESPAPESPPETPAQTSDKPGSDADGAEALSPAQKPPPPGHGRWGSDQ